MTMNPTLSKIVLFAAGATIGSAVTYALTKKRYEKLAGEEIQAVREYYDNKYKKSDNHEEEAEEESEESDELSEYEDVLKHTGYANTSNRTIRTAEGEGQKMMEDFIEVIPPDDFGEYEYETVSLTYYEADDVLVDEYGEVVGDIAELVGEDFTEHFGEYEQDSVFIRNHDTQKDYEILKDYGHYPEI